MNGYVFLDFDGVLNDAQTRRDFETPRYTRSFRPTGPVRVPIEVQDADAFTRKCVSNLNLITLITGAEIVITSAWRYHRGFSPLVALLGTVGVSGSVVGMLDGQACDDRGVRILDWLRMYTTATPPYVVLDDQDHDLTQLHPHVVTTDPEVGLTGTDVRRATAILRGDY
jgi:hypothetical protein